MQSSTSSSSRSSSSRSMRKLNPHRLAMKYFWQCCFFSLLIYTFYRECIAARPLPSGSILSEKQKETAVVVTTREEFQEKEEEEEEDEAEEEAEELEEEELEEEEEEEEEEAVESKKPYFILHIGPPKTATTTSQTILTVYKNDLEADNIVYLGFQSWPNQTYLEYPPHSLGSAIVDMFCHRLKISNSTRVWKQYKGKVDENCWQNLEHRLEGYRLRNQSIVLSDEVFTRGRTGTVNWEAMKELTEKVGYELYVMLGYRRLTDWYLSARRQIMFRTRKWTDTYPFEPFFPTYLNLAKQNIHTHYPTPGELVTALRDRHNVPIKLFNVYESDVLYENLLCNVVPHANTACQQARRDMAQNKTIHMALGEGVDTTRYMEITLLAYIRGLMVPSFKLGFKESIEKVQNYHEQQLGLTINDLPLICPSNETLEEFLHHSIQTEKELLPEFAASDRGELVHRANFWKNVNKKKYCSVDTEAVLQDDQWKHFFSKMHLDKP